MSNLHLNKKCNRCGLGVDDDGDGDCGICAGLTLLDILIVKQVIESLKSQNKGENGRRI